MCVRCLRCDRLCDRPSSACVRMDGAREARRHQTDEELLKLQFSWRRPRNNWKEEERGHKDTRVMGIRSAASDLVPRVMLMVKWRFLCRCASGQIAITSLDRSTLGTVSEERSTGTWDTHRTEQARCSGWRDYPVPSSHTLVRVCAFALFRSRDAKSAERHCVCSCPSPPRQSRC